jgi:hypothetical protein
MKEATMAHWAENQFEAADRAGASKMANEPRALSARYRAETGTTEVELSNGCSFAFPTALVQGLAGVGPEILEKVAPIGQGFGLEWEAADVQVTIAGLMAGVFGTERYMAELARRAGQSRSPAKSAAARSNGAKGGRPRKVALG